MNEDARTIWCGNLSGKCNEDILHELFLQAGPLEKVNIPKNSDGTIKSFGFVTYKHPVSVQYALSLFEGTSLFNRVLTLKARQNSDMRNLQPSWKSNLPDPNSILRYGHQLSSNQMYTHQNLIPMFIPSSPGLYPSQINSSFSPIQHDRRLGRNHPYARERDHERDRDRDRDRNRNPHRDHHKSNKDHKEHKNHKNQRPHRYHGRSKRNNR